MRLRRRPELRLLALAAIAAAAVFTLRSSHDLDRDRGRRPSRLPGAGSSATRIPRVSLGRQTIVVLRTPSVAAAARRAASSPTEQDERRWTAQALAAQQQVLTQLARHGLGVRPDYSFARVLDGFSAALDPRAVDAARAQPRGRGRLSGARRVPGRPSPRRAISGGPDGGDRGRRARARRERRLDRPARHRRRPRPALPRRPGRARDRHRRRHGHGRRPGATRSIAARSSGTGRSWPACSSARTAPAACTASLRARPCCRSASPAGSRPGRGATSSTRAATS